ncbi:MAG TPA: 50S ribosomal protein L18 [Phycisphaerae bacterium]|nr:50S ribosomal protein L18 [Phycisphaerae bacterium]
MKSTMKKQVRRQRRKRHVRKKISGTPDRPRLTVFRSHLNIYAQIIDDSAGRTLVASSTVEKPVNEKLGGKSGNSNAAQVVGETIASKAVKAGIKQVVFDRNGYAYHGRLRSLAEAARKGGLKF